MKPFRVTFQIAGSAHVSFRAHEKDDKFVVAKSTNPEALDNLIVMTGVNPGITETIKGNKNFISVMPKDGAAKLVAAAIPLLATKAEAFALNAAKNADGDASDDDGEEEAYED